MLLTYSYRVDLSSEGIKIDEKVYSSICECAHARLVVSGWINVVDADRVCAERLHQRGIALTLIVIDKWVVLGELVSNT